MFCLKLQQHGMKLLTRKYIKVLIVIIVSTVESKTVVFVSQQCDHMSLDGHAQPVEFRVF